MNKFLCLMAGLFCLTLCKAQTNELYNNLDFSNCSSGFFWDEIEQGEFPPTDTDYVAIAAEEAALYFIKAHFAAIDSSNRAGFSGAGLTQCSQCLLLWLACSQHNCKPPIARV
jgi:hypothetical protein